jgi:hypothetical protein
LWRLCFFWPAAAPLACGSIAFWAAKYESGDRHRALFHMLDCAASYKAAQDDIILLPVIDDALMRGKELAQMASQVFKTYNHLWGARKQPLYSRVFKAATGLAAPKKFYNYTNWYVVTAKSGANLRVMPSSAGEKLTAVKYSMQVKAIARQDQWVRVTPVGPAAFGRRFRGKTGYIHQSLLQPY